MSENPFDFTLKRMTDRRFALCIRACSVIITSSPKYDWKSGLCLHGLHLRTQRFSHTLLSVTLASTSKPVRLSGQYKSRERSGRKLSSFTKKRTELKRRFQRGMRDITMTCTCSRKHPPWMRLLQTWNYSTCLLYTSPSPRDSA